MKTLLLLFMFGIIQDPVEYKILFWNIENYFDTFDDPLTSDDEFTPSGERRWSWKRFKIKRDNIAKVIISQGKEEEGGEGSYPAIVAFAEVENRFVLEQLVRSSPLAMLDYGIIHRNSPDERGIDVALLYKKSLFRPVSYKFLKVDLPAGEKNTRLILYTKGVLEDLDTLHIFVNHWPSKYGGEKKSLPNREKAASTLLKICDSLLKDNPCANIVVTGDFNDTPFSGLFTQFLNLVNLARPFAARGEGTIKYKGKWEIIDLFFISPNLLNKNEPIACEEDAMEIIRNPYLLEKDPVYLGERPRRCYYGPRYNGGISDHLPVILTIKKRYDSR